MLDYILDLKSRLVAFILSVFTVDFWLQQILGLPYSLGKNISFFLDDMQNPDKIARSYDCLVESGFIQGLNGNFNSVAVWVIISIALLPLSVEVYGICKPQLESLSFWKKFIMGTMLDYLVSTSVSMSLAILWLYVVLSQGPMYKILLEYPL